ncbi:phosphate/phosphite/phosphonate ABC transporter substrate-binding protein [Rhodoferax sp. GW822-FHT02A01]|uniref:phosphate/phosphite/phosphonate ABC transporter substrate-binding protein n=1 Tax=Rhodoferax sp. GW822-FHT02A01 TaxID=3141537 RepID=UPI00315D8E3D
MKKRLNALLAAALAIFLGLMSGGAHAEPPSYNFSPVNQYDINLTAAYWNPIIAYVSEKSGVKLNLKIGRTSADTTSFVLAKEVEFVFSNHLFSPEREQLGWKVFGRRNTPTVQGQIVVPADSPITDIAQLKGQEVAFAGPEAFIIYKVPYAYLLSKNVDVKVVFAGNQNAAFAQLFAGKVVASGGNSQLVDGYSRREGKKFRVLWSSEPFQDLALMASSKVPEADVRKVAAAFIDMYKDPKGRDILHQASKEVGLPNDAYFVAASAADYAAYKRFYQSAPVSLH